MVAGGCGGKTTDDSRSTETEPSPPAESPAGEPGFPPSTPPADPGLAFSPVSSPGAPPAVVWSWTTTEQADEIRRDKVLFTRESSPTLGRGFLYDVLEERAAKGDAVAARLAGTELAKGRYGWSNPWATVRGATPTETYGDELLMIEMRADTWYARVRSDDKRIDFVDSSGSLVPTDEALASFERVGGILFDHDRETSAHCFTGSGGGGLVYREIYVGNEARLASVSHRTGAILDVLEAHIQQLEVFSLWLRAQGDAPLGHLFWPCDAYWTWQRKPLDTVERYLGSLAFATDAYRPTAQNVDAIVAELRKRRFVPAPFTHSP